MNNDVTVNAKGDTVRVSWREAAAFYRQAANILRSQGYTPYPEYEGESGYSLGMALCLATRCTDDPERALDHISHTAICEEVRRRLIGYLYLTANLFSTHHGASLADEIEWWERDPSAPGQVLGENGRYIQRDQVVAMLAATASILDNEIDMYAKTMIRRPAGPDNPPLG